MLWLCLYLVLVRQKPKNEIKASDGQFLRVSLQSFNMFKNFYNVNTFNSEFVLGLDGTLHVLNLSHKDYASQYEIANDMSAQIEAQFNALGKTVASIQPHISNVFRGGTTDKIIDFTITFSSAHGYSNVLLQTNSTKNDGEYNSSSFLLGGARLTTGSTNTSFTITPSSTTLRFTAPFPSQIATEEHIYLRTNLQSTNLESSNYTHSISNHTNHLLSSNIFAKIPSGFIRMLLQGYFKSSL